MHWCAWRRTVELGNEAKTELQFALNVAYSYAAVAGGLAKAEGPALPNGS